MKSEIELKNEKRDIESLKALLKKFLASERLASHELVRIAEMIHLLKEEIGKRLIEIGCTKRDLKNYIMSKPSVDSQVMAAEQLLEVATGFLTDNDLRFILEWLPKCPETDATKEKAGRMLLKKDTSTLSIHCVLKHVDDLAGEALEAYLKKNPKLTRLEIRERLGL